MDSFVTEATQELKAAAQVEKEETTVKEPEGQSKEDPIGRKLIDSNPSTPQSGVTVLGGVSGGLKGLVTYFGDESDESDDNSDADDEDSTEIDTPMSRVSPLPPLTESPLARADGEPFETPVVTANRKDRRVVKIPPEPEGRCSKALQDKFTELIERQKHRLVSTNQSIQSRKAFRNPSIYEKLIEHIGIVEYGTCYPKHLYNPTIWGPEDYYDKLGEKQQKFLREREAEKAKNRTKVEFVSGKKSGVPGKEPITTTSSTAAAKDSAKSSSASSKPSSSSSSKPSSSTTSDAKSSSKPSSSSSSQPSSSSSSGQPQPLMSKSIPMAAVLSDEKLKHSSYASAVGSAVGSSVGSAVVSVGSAAPSGAIQASKATGNTAPPKYPTSFASSVAAFANASALSSSAASKSAADAADDNSDKDFKNANKRSKWDMKPPN